MPPRSRPKPSPLDDLLDAVALFPWWVGVLLALGLYLLLNILADGLHPVARSGRFSDVSDMAMDAMLQGLTEAAKVLLPAVCLAAAAASAWRRRRRAAQADPAGPDAVAHLLHGMRRQDFESLVAEAFRLRGFRVMETGRGGDHGVDLVLHKAGQTQLVHCREWKAAQVGADTVHELCGLMAARGAAGGWVLSAGRFSDEALRAAADHGVRLIDGPQLKSMLDRAAIARQNRPPAPDMADTVPAWPRQPSVLPGEAPHEISPSAGPPQARG